MKNLNKLNFVIFFISFAFSILGQDNIIIVKDNYLKQNAACPQDRVS